MVFWNGFPFGWESRFVGVMCVRVCVCVSFFDLEKEDEKE